MASQKNYISSNGLKITLVGDNVIRVCSETLLPVSPGNSLHKYGFLREKDVPVPVEVQISKNTIASTLNSVSFTKDGNIAVRSQNLELELEFNISKQHTTAGYCLCWSLVDGERFYGLGDQTRECIEHRGQRANMHVTNVKSYIPIPFVMSSRGYGVLINTTYRHEWDLGKNYEKMAEISVPNGSVDFYIFLGENFKTILHEYTLLAGRPMLPPKWSFGLWFICRTQADDREVVSDALNFRERKFPCDVIGLEPGWMESDYDYSTVKKWNSERFHIPPYNKKHNFISALKRMGFKLSLWLCQNYDLSYEADRQFLNINDNDNLSDKTVSEFHEDDTERDEHFLHSVLSDTLTNPEEPWFKHLKKFVDQGADMFKQDGSLQVNDHPDRLWGNGMTDDEMHNLYPLLYSQQMYNGFCMHTGKRACCFTAAGWIGLQRYTGTWTGDTGGEEKTLVACLNLAMVAHSLVTCDMEITTPEGIHYGFLLPWSQVNSWNYFRHPWLLGDEIKPVFTFYANLRSQLIPYLYTYAYIAHTTGCPMLRPVVMEFPDDEKTFYLKTQWMLGGELMASCFSEEVYFPSGTKWLDLWNGEIYEGGQTVKYDLPASRGGGLFVREGSILPLGPVRQYVNQPILENNMELHIFPSMEGNSEFSIYDDDGISFSYQNGDYRLDTIRVLRINAEIEILCPDSLSIASIYLYSETEIEKITLNNKEIKLQREPDKLNIFKYSMSHICKHIS